MCSHAYGSFRDSNLHKQLTMGRDGIRAKFLLKLQLEPKNNRLSGLTGEIEQSGGKNERSTQRITIDFAAETHGMRIAHKK